MGERRMKVGMKERERERKERKREREREKEERERVRRERKERREREREIPAVSHPIVAVSFTVSSASCCALARSMRARC